MAPSSELCGQLENLAATVLAERAGRAVVGHTCDATSGTDDDFFAMLNPSSGPMATCGLGIFLMPSSDRPRDELGRPLPAGSRNRLKLPYFDAMSIDENHTLAMEYFDAGNYFAAHEAWESCWVQAKGSPEEKFFKGLAQLGAGYTHYRRNNPHGARVLLERALDRISAYGSLHRGIDVDALVRVGRRTHQLAEAAERRATRLPPLSRVGVPRMKDESR